MKPQILEVCNRARLFLGGEWMRAQEIAVTREAWELCHRLRAPSEPDVKALKRILFRFDFRNEDSLRKERNALIVALKEVENAPVESPFIPVGNSYLPKAKIEWGGASEKVSITPAVHFRAEKIIAKEPLSPQEILKALRPTLADNRPAVRPLVQKAVDYQLSLGSVEGKAGEVKTVCITPQMLFRGEKLVTADDCKDGVGFGTEIVHFFVGAMSQFPPDRAMPTWSFAPGNLGSGIKLDTCQVGVSISVAVKFLKDCTWSGVIFGKALKQ